MVPIGGAGHTSSVIRYEPQLATLAEVPPDDDDLGWLSELKQDGYRMSVQLLAAGRARLISRHGRGWSDSFPTIVRAARTLPFKTALLDGELTVVMPNGLTSFEALQHRRALPPGSRIIFWAFDFLFANGKDLRRQPLSERKAQLEHALGADGVDDAIRYMPHIVGHSRRVFERAREIGAEGIVCKRLAATHVPGRSRDWLKCKCIQTKPFVVGGFTHAGGGAHAAVSGLLVGYYDAKGRLRHAGHVGAGKGFTREFLQTLYAQIIQLEQPRSPFARYEPSVVRSPWHQERALAVRWVKPLVVVDVGFLELSSWGQLRHASFRGFRADVQAHDVIRHDAR